MKTLLVALAVSAAMACGTAQPYLDSQAGPSPVVLKDSSAQQLDVTVMLNMGGYDASSRDRTMIDVFFQHAGRPVQFVAGEHVDCAALALTRYTGSFEVTVSTASIAGKVVTCAYTSGHQAAPFMFRVPEGLLILSPRQNQRVTRSANTVITYSGGSGAQPWVVALGTQAKAVASPDAITAASATLDTSTVGAGEGSIALTDPNNFPLAEIGGKQFHSVGGSARRMTMVAVVWV